MRNKIAGVKDTKLENTASLHLTFVAVLSLRFLILTVLVKYLNYCYARTPIRETYGV